MSATGKGPPRPRAKAGPSSCLLPGFSLWAASALCPHSLTPVESMGLLQRWHMWKSPGANKSAVSNVSVTKEAKGVPSDDKFPEWPPESPAIIISDRAKYRQQIRCRGYDSPRGIFHDRPIDAFYRLYEFFTLDYVYGYRNELEYFWKQHSWAVKDITDPQDCDPARYAFLACIPALMVQAFNAKIALGLPRNAPHIMSPEQAEDYRNAPESSKTYEEVPKWCELVAPLSKPLLVPTHEGVILDNPDDERLQQDLKKKNIFVWAYHIHFT